MNIYINNRLKHTRSLRQKLTAGFTIIELITVISIVGILATISIVSYGNWQKSVIEAQLKSDLNGVASALEDYRNFNNNYPSSIPTTFSPSEGVSLSISSDGKLYCVDAASSKDLTISYYIDESISGQGARIGTCASRPAAPTNLIATVVSNSSISLSWDASALADTYTLQQATTSSFINPSTVATQAGTSFVSNGLASSTKYYYRVKATVANIDSVWSSPANNTTVTPPTTPAAPVIAVVLNGANVVATVTPVAACTTGILQYGINSRLNNGSWTGWTAWSSTLSFSQAANDGVKYGYQARTRCYLDPVSSAISVGVEASYTDPIGIPTTPTVAVSTVGATSTFSWGATVCTTGNTARYQYRYTISPSGYNSGLVATASTSVAFTTSTEGQTYTVQVQAECYSVSTSSGMSTAGSGSYYRIITYTLTIAAGTGGTVNASGTYNEGTVQTITATPSVNYSFTSWSGSTGCSGVASHTITMDASKSCTANFTIITYTLTIAAGAGGTVNAGGTYNSGTSQTITATPNTNYAFTSWSGSTGCSGAASHTITMNAAKSCTANFTIITYTLTIIAGANGTVNAGGTYNSGTSQTIAANPNGYYKLYNWSGSAGCAGADTHTITMDANKTCTANFYLPTYTLTLGKFGASGWLWCGYENAACTYGGIYGGNGNIKFGVDTRWKTINFGVKADVTGIACNSATFGIDPAPGTVKMCYYEVYSTVSGGGTFTAGTLVTLSGYPSGQFRQWECLAAGQVNWVVDYSINASIRMDANKTCNAQFNV